MTYFEIWFKFTQAKLNKLHRYYIRSPNIYCKYERLSYQYQFVYHNLELMLPIDSLRNIIINMIKSIPFYKKDLHSSSLTYKVKKKFYNGLNRFLKKYHCHIENINRGIIKITSLDYQKKFEFIFVNYLFKMFDKLNNLNSCIVKNFYKQGLFINSIYSYLGKFLKLILNNPKFYCLISISIQRANIIKEELQLLPLKIRKRLKKTLRRYLDKIQSWKWFRYQCLWFSKQVPILEDNRSLVADYLFPKICL